MPSRAEQEEAQAPSESQHMQPNHPSTQQPIRLHMSQMSRPNLLISPASLQHDDSVKPYRE